MSCHNCVEIKAIEAGSHPWAIARLPHGYVWLNPTQYHRGATFYVAKRCVAELYELEPPARGQHLMEMAAEAAAVQRAVGARKMNYEALGNLVPHLHWWLTPRHHDDSHPSGPIWEDLTFLRLLWTKQAVTDAAASLRERSRILEALRREDVEIEREYV